MQKRRGKQILPVTASDNITNASPRKWNKVAHRKHDFNLSGKSLVSLVLVFIVLLLYIAATGGKSSEVKSKMQDRLNIAAYKKYFKSNYNTRSLPLSKFKTLEYALANSELTVLYFAASWCRMSTPVSNDLDEAFPPKEKIILPRRSTEVSIGTKRKTLAIVYVSSDKSEEEMDNYSRKNWINVPYNSSERIGLKRHFQVCSKPELDELDMIRNFEIPTIVVIDSLTHGILTTSGQVDIEDEGSHVLEHWLSLRDTVRGLEDKYEER